MIIDKIMLMTMIIPMAMAAICIQLIFFFFAVTDLTDWCVRVDVRRFGCDLPIP